MVDVECSWRNCYKFFLVRFKLVKWFTTWYGSNGMESGYENHEEENGDNMLSS